MNASRRGSGRPVNRLALDPLELVEYTRLAADEVRAGRYPYVQYNDNERWHQRLYRDHRVDLWLISWLPSQGTQLHDHGGSSGAFTVLSGRLCEAVFQPGHPGGPELRDLDRRAGASVGFGSQYVHDVRNMADSPAVSVHAYSPPLTTMNFYDLEDGALHSFATLATEDPEPAATELEAFGKPAA